MLAVSAGRFFLPRGIFSIINGSDAEASFLDLHLSISDGFVGKG